MLSEIIEHAVASEPDIAIVKGAMIEADGLGSFLRLRRIDVTIFPASFHAGAEELDQDQIVGLLHANPRLGFMGVDGIADRGELHHLVPTRNSIGRLTLPSMIAGIRAAAEMKRR